jgi:hypothetical protein
MWYIFVPQLIFRNPRKSSIKNTEIIIMRCTAFLGGNDEALLDKWKIDRKKALRLARKRKPEDERARVKRAAHGTLKLPPVAFTPTISLA